MALRMLVCLLLLSCVPPLWAADDAGAGAPQPQRVLILAYHRFATTRVDSTTLRM